MWFSDLTSLDPALKHEMWASQALFFMKRSGGSQLFLDPVKAKKYRDGDQLKIDEKEFKEMVDPTTPLGAGGKAAYFSSDFSANPIYIHLKNITKAEIEKVPKQLEVNLTDKYAKTRQMNDNYKILYQAAFRRLINKLSADIGVPGVSENQDPYKWADNLFKKDGENQSPDMVNKYLDLIRNSVTDSQDMALYNELIYKGDYELAFELGIKYYIMDLNKWHERWSDEFINDVMHFNKACGEYYTDLISGRPIIERFVPEALWTSPFKRKDGEDITYYWTEYTISFGDFVRTMGKNLKPDKLKEVFELMKSQGWHSVDWRDEFMSFGGTNYTRDNASVRVGRAAMLSTDMEVHMENEVSGGYETEKPLSWEPTDPNEKRIEKRYNVWRWWYYIPPATNSVQNANWEWQSKYIFELQKFQDQQRYGDDGRYSKSPLVIYDNSSQATYSDIVQAFMPKIHHLWHKYQNYLVNDVDATILSDDFIGGLLGAVDEDNKINPGDPNKPTGGNGTDAYMEQWKMIKQGGTGFLKMTDNKGNQILDPAKLAVVLKNNYLEKAEKSLVQMLMLYDLMIKSLAFSPATAGEEVKPRTPVAALEQTLAATNSSRFFIQKGYEDFLQMYAERIVRYIIGIFNENDDYRFPYRYDEFMDNVGYANGLALEGLKDIELESIGLTVNYVDNTAKKEFIMALATEYVKSKELSDEFLYLLMGVDNWKYAFVLMRMSLKEKRKQNQEMAQQEHQRAMEGKQMDLQIAMALQQAQVKGKNENIMTQGQVDEMVEAALNKNKYMAQSQLKKETDQLRQSENYQKSELKKGEDTNKANLESQKPITV